VYSTEKIAVTIWRKQVVCFLKLNYYMFGICSGELAINSLA